MMTNYSELNRGRNLMALVRSKVVLLVLIQQSSHRHSFHICVIQRSVYFAPSAYIVFDS